MAKLGHRQQRGRDVDDLQPFFDSARTAPALPEWLEHAILQDAKHHQPKALPVRLTSIRNRLRPSAWGWRLGGLFAASAGTGLAIGMGSAGAVEAITVGFGTVSGVAGADIFSGLDALLLE